MRNTLQSTIQDVVYQLQLAYNKVNSNSEPARPSEPEVDLIDDTEPLLPSLPPPHNGQYELREDYDLTCGLREWSSFALMEAIDSTSQQREHGA